jgi:outer membrane protein assembly factor BamB
MGQGMTRRGLLRAGAAGTAVAALTPDVLAAAPPRYGDWPMTGRDLRARRWTRDAVEGLDEQWRLRLAGGVPGAPAVAGSRVFAASYGGEVVAADLRTGREVWRVQLPLASYGDSITVVGSREQGCYAGPAVAGERVIVAWDRVRCLHARTGDTLWESPALRTEESDDYFWGAPVIAGDTVLVGSGSGSELPRARGKVTAYGLHDGRLLWSTATVPEGGNGGGLIGPVSVDAGRGVVYAVTGSPYERVDGPNPGTCALLELDLAAGAIRWQDQVHEADDRGFDFNSAPVLAGRRLFATAKDGVYAWDRLDHRRLWHRQLTPAQVAPALGTAAGPTDGPEGGPIAADADHVYALSNDAARASFRAAALDPATGAVVWERDLPGLAFAAPIVAGRTLYMASAAGVLHALKTRDGSDAARPALLREPSSGAPAAARGRLVVGTGAAPYLPGDSLVCLGA